MHGGADAVPQHDIRHSPLDRCEETPTALPACAHFRPRLLARFAACSTIDRLCMHAQEHI